MSNIFLSTVKAFRSRRTTFSRVAAKALTFILGLYLLSPLSRCSSTAQNAMIEDITEKAFKVVSDEHSIASKLIEEQPELTVTVFQAVNVWGDDRLRDRPRHEIQVVHIRDRSLDNLHLNHNHQYDCDVKWITGPLPCQFEAWRLLERLVSVVALVAHRRSLERWQQPCPKPYQFELREKNQKFQLLYPLDRLRLGWRRILYSEWYRIRDHWKKSERSQISCHIIRLTQEICIKSQPSWFRRSKVVASEDNWL